MKRNGISDLDLHQLISIVEWWENDSLDINSNQHVLFAVSYTHLTITVFVRSNNTSKVEIIFTLNTDSSYTPVSYTHLNANNTGYVMPTPVIRHFREDIKDGVYDGYVDMGIQAAPILNPAMRKAFGLPEMCIRDRISYNGSQIAQGRDAAKEALKSNPDLYKEIEELVKAKMDEKAAK